MPLLIAEELLLVTAGPDGRGPARGTEVDCALGGSLLVELVLDGLAELDGRVVRVRDSSTPFAPDGTRRRLVEARDTVAARPRRAKALVPRLGKGTRQRLLGDLIRSGVLADEPYRWLGFIPRHRYTATDTKTRDEVVGRLRAAVLEGQPPSQRTAALACMVSAAKLERRVFPDADRRTVKRRLRQITEGDWATKAVREAITAIHAATSAAVVAATSAATSGG